MPWQRPGTFLSGDAFRLLKQDRPVAELTAELFRVVHTMKGDFALRQMHNYRPEPPPCGGPSWP